MTDAPQPTENDPLWQAYRRAIFSADAPGGRMTIRIDQNHPVLDEAVAQAGCDCWCFITAWNPASEPLDPEENATRNAALAAELKREGRVFYPGRGQDAEGAWPAEESFLVFGLQREVARQAGQRHGQNAVVWGEVGGPAQLIDSRGPQPQR